MFVCLVLHFIYFLQQKTKHMMKKKTSSSIVFTLMVLFAITFVSEQTIEFCSTTKSSDVVALIGDELTTFSLSDYVRGYNLKFSSDKPTSARAWNPLEFIASTTLSFNQGYKIVNVDVLESVDKKWLGQGVILTQKNTTTISLGMGRISGAKGLISDIKYKYYNLPLASNCFSAQIVDQNYNVVLDCQSADGNTDLVCFVDSVNSVLTCSQVDSLNKVKDRKSQTLQIGSQIYLVTATYSRDSAQKQMTYLTLYHVDVENTFIDFVNIIDGYQLGLGHDITVSDFEIGLDSRIIIHDVKGSQVLFVKYTLPNQISLDEKPWVYGGQGQEIEVTAANTLMIATHSSIDEYSLDTRKRIFSYQLDKSDNQIVDITANAQGVVTQTSKGQLFIYERSNSLINNLLAKVSILNKDYLLSPYTNILELFDQRGQQLHEFSTGTLYLSNIAEDTKVTIKAKSTSAQCSFTVQLLKKTDQDKQKIVIKQDITSKHFKTQADSIIGLNLEQIYSGENLRYSTPASSDQIKYTLEQMGTFTLKTTLQNALMTQVVNVDKKSFMLLGLTSQNVYIELCKVDQDSGQINCAVAYQSKLFSKDSITSLAGKQRKSGQIVFSWTYTGMKFQTIHFFNGKFRPMFTMSGTDYDYSSIVINQDKIFYTLKQFGLIQVLVRLPDNTYTIYQINNKNFKPNTNDKIVGFYPRQIYLHPWNNQLFYIKLPQHVCLMTMVGSKVVTIQCTEVLDKLIPDEQWGVVFGTNSWVLFTPDGVQEISYSGVMPVKLHDIKLDSDYTFPIFYSVATNTIVFKTVDHSIVYYKLNKPVIDSLYYQTGQSEYFSSEGLWTVSINNLKVYRQSLATKLNVELVGDKTSFKQDLHFMIKVASQSDEVNSETNVTVINYPTKIVQKNTTNSVMKLPQTATNISQKIDMSTYFSGIVSTYNIICDYCSNNKISLQTLFRNPVVNQEIIGSKSFLEVFNQNILILTNNRINLVDKDAKLITYKVIQNVKECSEMGWDEKVGLLVFCQDATGQEILLFDVNENDITQQQSYQLQNDAVVTTASQLIIQRIDATTSYVFIEDNDISDLQQSPYKHANVKVFVLTPTDLTYKGLLTSQSFGFSELQSINDIDIQKNYIIASIGNVGFGISQLSVNPNAESVLVDPTIVDFDAVEALEKYTLDDSVFHQVQVVKIVPGTGISLFVTSTTSIPMVVEFTWQRTGHLVFSKIAQAYNRYGDMPIVNWQFVSQTYILLSYYSITNQQQHIVYHPRPTTQGTNLQPFVQAYRVQIPQSLLLEHDIFLTSTNYLFVSDTGSALNKDEIVQSMYIGSELKVDPKIYRLWVSPKVEFNLWLNYNAKGTFSTIKLSASNYYSSSWTTINVQFGQNSDDNGVKWYTIMIIALAVLIIVGVGYGMYLKMVKNRKEKKVSLLTQGEADEFV